jgi:broad-specificity NMP kinase
MIGHHIDDAVYGPLYFGYGGDDEPNGKARTVYSRIVERQIIEFSPRDVLVLVKASPEVIARRMKENPHRIGVVKEEDIEHVLGRFEEEFNNSIIHHKFTLDTSTATVDETMAEFATKVEPYLSDEERERILTRSNLFGDR